MGREVTLDALDWPALVRPGDLVAWGQASAEPIGLTSTLVDARSQVGGFRAFVGMSYAPTVDPGLTDWIQYSSYCGTGNNRLLGDALGVWPIPYSDIACAISRFDPVVLISICPGADEDHFGLCLGADYIADILPQARLVIAEMSSRSPRPGAGRDLHRSQIDFIIRSEHPPLRPAESATSEAERKIAGHIAGLVEDGSVLQLGLGSVPAAAVRALSDHRRLGIHSGQIGDDVAALADAGVITNEDKQIDQGYSVVGVLSGGAGLVRWAHNNPKLRIRATSYTHDPVILASLDRFVAINSAIEIDLSGQINAEVAGGRYVGAVGGAPAFLRGAAASRGGLPIVALPSLAGGGRSRIVERLSGPVSTARCDAGIIVTEHGVADLRGLDLTRRRQALLDIADPSFREGIAS